MGYFLSFCSVEQATSLRGIFKVFQAQEDTLPSHAFSAASCFAGILGLPSMTFTNLLSVMNSGN